MTRLHTEPEMIGFELTHSLLRTEIVGLAAAFSRPLATKDQDMIEDHLRLVTDHLVRHHEEEDNFHWPLLASRAPELAAVLDRLEDEHTTLGPQLDIIRDSTAPVERRGAALRDLARDLVDHFDREDRTIIPALRQHISPQEQADSMERSRRKIPANDELRVLSMMLDSANDGQLDRMLAVLPDEAIAAWRTFGAPQLAEIHSGLNRYLSG